MIQQHLVQEYSVTELHLCRLHQPLHFLLPLILVYVCVCVCGVCTNACVYVLCTMFMYELAEAKEGIWVSCINYLPSSS